ncbi:MAG TPA: type II secretion system protein GspG [Phycisphaerae bacterium]|nr:type II secretion system protein GspG [Phycisphaerae bacterium]
MFRRKILIPAGTLGLLVAVFGLLLVPTSPEATLTPKEAAHALFKYPYDGDEKSLSSLLADDGSPEAALFRAMPRIAVSESALGEAYDKVFGTHRMEAHRKDLAAMMEEIDNGKVQIDRDTATIAMQGGASLVMQKKEGKWRIDCKKSMPTFWKRPGAAKDGADRALAEAKVRTALAEGVLAHKFASYEDARQEEARRLATLPETKESREREISSTQLTLRLLTTAAEMYRLNHGTYPSQSEGAQVLKSPADEKARTDEGSFHHDAWGNPYVYRNPAATPARFEIFSCGPDGKPDTDDDVHVPAD